ncbi:FMN-dependent NADPH-azoreductase [Caulifigura coniformis]|uniref:FMN-dependent NADPH-azoreductase n=1 Tax=Caulifigura coniformis TaxID=2527983 RepID=A0A517SH48_9PLAN|nr:NAD(P)H-dependent oxidoreductase [Caulifigura coniformis]QDT55448.1 FMN-dependent NADPH-azoreductase [Caulifigura coniformis]
MAAGPKILVLAGSVRKASFNRRLASLAAHAARAAGGDVTHLDLADYPLPLMNEDLQAEQGVPKPAQALKKLFAEQDGLLLACPEYNSGITPLLKNVIDWVSRKEGDEQPLVAYRGKVVGLMSASPSPFGGMRGLVQVRSILGNIGVLVLADQVQVPKAHEAFQPDGTLKDAALAGRVTSLAQSVVTIAGKLTG